MKSDTRKGSQVVEEEEEEEEVEGMKEFTCCSVRSLSVFTFLWVDGRTWQMRARALRLNGIFILAHVSFITTDKNV